MKNTHQRSLIFEIVSNSYEHLNAYEIYEKARKEIPKISLGTVYRNLSLLVEKKLIKKIVIDGSHDRYDRMDNHNHFICYMCDEIYDLNDEFRFQKSINGHKVMDCEIIFKGICKKCKEKE